MDKKTIAECLKRLNEKDMSALRELYECLSVPLYTYIYRITLDRALAEDVLHDTFLKLAKPIHANVKNPTAYIYTAARNTAIDAVRRQNKNCPGDNTLYEDFENGCVVMMDVESALRSLDDDVRQTVTLRISSELTFAEISVIMDQSLAKVYRNYLKGISRLKEMLSGGEL